MPTYKVTDPRTGRTVRLTAQDNSPPTEQELEHVFSKIGNSPSSSQQWSPDELAATGQIRLPSALGFGDFVRNTSHAIANPEWQDVVGPLAGTRLAAGMMSDVGNFVAAPVGAALEQARNARSIPSFLSGYPSAYSREIRDFVQPRQNEAGKPDRLDSMVKAGLETGGTTTLAKLLGPLVNEAEGALIKQSQPLIEEGRALARPRIAISGRGMTTDEIMTSADRGIEVPEVVRKKLNGQQRAEYYGRLKDAASRSTQADDISFTQRAMQDKDRLLGEREAIGQNIDRESMLVDEELLARQRDISARKSQSDDLAIRKRQELPAWKAKEQARIDSERDEIKKLIEGKSRQKAQLVREKGQQWLKSRSDTYEAKIEPGLRQAGDQMLSREEMFQEISEKLFPNDAAKQAEAMRVLFPDNAEGSTLRAAYDNSKKYVEQSGGYAKSGQLMNERQWMANQVRQSVLRKMRERKITAFDDAHAFWSETSEIARPLVRDFRVFDKTNVALDRGARRLVAAARRDTDSYIKEIEEVLGENLTDDLKQEISRLTAAQKEKTALGLTRQLKEQAIANEKRLVASQLRNETQTAENLAASRKSLLNQKKGELVRSKEELASAAEAQGKQVGSQIKALKDERSRQLEDEKFWLDERERKIRMVWDLIRNVGVGASLTGSAVYGVKKLTGG